MKQIFTIMPSEAYPDAATKRLLIEQCFRDAGWRVLMPEYDKDLPDFDLEKTKMDLKNSDLVLVDLSDERPSCYFELGLAEAVGAPVAVISKADTPIHQTSLRSSVSTFSNIDEFENLLASILGKNTDRC